MAQQDSEQKAIVGRVMHEFRHGDLETQGRKVRNPRQAVAIGLSEAGASRTQTPAENRKRRTHTRQRERAEGPNRTELYAEAKQRGIAGRSRMTMAELLRALGR